MRFVLVGVLWGVAVAVLAQTIELVGPNAPVRWRAENDVANLKATANGLSIQIGGEDPYISSDPFDAPKAENLWIDVDLLSDQGGSAQIFYSAEKQPPAEARSVRFAVKKAERQQLRLAIPRIADRMRLRFDPPGTQGRCELFSLRVSPAQSLRPPESMRPVFVRESESLRLPSGGATLEHSKSSTDFWLKTGGAPMAHGNPSGCIGWSKGGKPTWTPIGKASVSLRGKTLVATAKAGPLSIERRFRPCPGGFEFVVRFVSSSDLEVLYAPAMMVFAGQGAFEDKKRQALFCGLEYLEGEEPSSSEKDIVGPEAVRRVPLDYRVTIPLMAVTAEGRFVALAWQRNAACAAFFDSPDRTYGSAGHVLGLLVPGSTGSERIENELVAYRGLALKKDAPVEFKGWILTGAGDTAVDAIKAYLAVAPQPKPLRPMPLKEYAALAARGWLDSGINENGLYRHAYWPGIDWFKPAPAPDAAAYMRWLVPFVSAETGARLREGTKLALSRVDPSRVGLPAISHLPTFGNALVLGGVKETVEASKEQARAALARIRGDGTEKYAPQGTDYGKTHFADHANGLTGKTLLTAIESALFCGDPALIEGAVAALRKARVYRGTVPRGAQTWEIPLHTPDILASAHLCKAYVLAYEATGDASFLQDAEYWAYTGLPFVYLDNPTEGKVGQYATIAVYGATNWVSPNWMGLPVQWCGAVYADALYAFAPHAKSPLWKTLADGIFDSGVAQTFNDERKDLAGLLPDSFNLSLQSGNPVAINPGTLQALAPRRHGLAPFYSWLGGVSAPGRLSLAAKDRRSMTVKVEPAFEGPYWVVVSGPRAVASVQADGKETALEKVGEHAAAFRLEGPAQVRIVYGQP